MGELFVYLIVGVFSAAIASLDWKKLLLLFLSAAFFVYGIWSLLVSIGQEETVGNPFLFILVGISLYALLAIWLAGDGIAFIGYRRQLVRQVRDGNDTAITALDELRAEDHLSGQDGWLVGANLGQASLQGADLHDANLSKTGLEKANLQGANLQGANLRSARLNGANLRQADLRRANLHYAHLQNADLREAFLCDACVLVTDLEGVHLEGANLRGADLDDVSFQDAYLDEHTVLPNGHKWKSSTDRIRF